MKKAIGLLVIIIILTSPMKIEAATLPFLFEESEDNADYEWEDDKETVFNASIEEKDGELRYEPQWVLRDTEVVQVPSGTITLSSYTMEYLNGTKSCMGITTHSVYLCGYVRARFETVLGEVISGSDSGRVISFYGSQAVTPTAPVTEGWSGIAHTYCGAF